MEWAHCLIVVMQFLDRMAAEQSLAASSLLRNFVINDELFASTALLTPEWHLLCFFFCGGRLFPIYYSSYPGYILSDWSDILLVRSLIKTWFSD